jgi:alginate O-acetyltransferase complex protein AlgJ
MPNFKSEDMEHEAPKISGEVICSYLFVFFAVGALLVVLANSLGQGLSQIEANLWNKQNLITLNTEIRLFLGNRVFPQVIIGKGGWLQFSFEDSINDYQNTLPIKKTSLEIIQKKSQQLYNHLSSRNAHLIIIIAPNKATIYPEKMPDEIPKINKKSRMDLLMAYMQSNGPPVFIDLRPALLAARSKYPVYYKTDTHWNSYGAYIAYKAIMGSLSSFNPALAPYPLDRFKPVTSEPSKADLSNMLGSQSILESRIRLIPRFITNKKGQALQADNLPRNDLPSLVMYHDSFGVTLVPFVSLQFKDPVYIRFSNNKDTQNLHLIDKLHPDVVIIELVERDLNKIEALLATYPAK